MACLTLYGKKAYESEVMMRAEDSIVIPAFQIEVDLHDSSKKLKSRRETIIVAAYFSGIPSDKSSPEYNKKGTVSIGSHSIELIEEGIAGFKNVRVSRSSYEALEDKNFDVLINVFSGRKSSKDNILRCGILQMPIDEIKGKTHKISGFVL